MSVSRKEFLKESGFIATGLISGGFGFSGLAGKKQLKKGIFNNHEYEADLMIIGGGTGGCAAALSACKMGLKVIMTETTDWIGGQLTSQGVPPDENPWVETFGASRSYQYYRELVRKYYRDYYPLVESEKNNPGLNPGNGWVSRLCHEPHVSALVLENMLIPYVSNGQLLVLTEHTPAEVETEGDFIRSVVVKDEQDGTLKKLSAPWCIDATEMGDLLALGNVEYVVGAEGQNQTGEPHAPEAADPNNVQAFNLCFFMEYHEGENYVGDKPEGYEFWRQYVPGMDPPWSGKLLSLKTTHPITLEPREIPFDPAEQDGWWSYRQIVDHKLFENGFYRGPITCVNWPQHAYLKGKIVDEPEEVIKTRVKEAENLNLSLLYWLQTEVPRLDGGQGWPGLRLWGANSALTKSGMAKHAYIRESRRIKARFTVLEQHVGTEARMAETGLNEDDVRAALFDDSVGIGAYRIDLHPSTRGNNYIDISSLPFQIPLGALIPRRVRNLIPACKNIGTTHITNGCYRLHPVEWNIGESAGALIGYCSNKNLEPHQVYESSGRIADYQSVLKDMGVRLSWPSDKVHAL
jgi:hypothetical protein